MADKKSKEEAKNENIEKQVDKDGLDKQVPAESTVILGGAGEGGKTGEQGGAGEQGAGDKGGAETGGQEGGLLEQIRKRRREKDQSPNGPSGTDDGKGGKDVQGGTGSKRGNAGSGSGIKGNNGTTARNDRGHGRTDSAANLGGGGSDKTPQSTKRQSGGLTLEGFKGGKAGGGTLGFPTPQLGEVLTEKEAKEYRDKMSGVLLTIFRYMDEGISATNREKAKAKIWSDMDDDDVGVLVDVLIDGAKRSRIVATAVRQVTRSYNLLRVGIITGPRFMQTVQHYQKHGGFTFPFGGQAAQPIISEDE